MASLGEVQIDVVESDKVNYSNTVTEKPVENEEDISDHIKQNPIKINLRCYFAGIDAQDKHQNLKEMRDSEELFVYKGSLGTYKNMAIQELSPMKEAQYGNGFECTIVLKQVRIASSQIITVELGTDPATGNQVQGGSSETEEKDEDSEEKDEESADKTTLGIVKDKVESWGGE